MVEMTVTDKMGATASCVTRVNVNGICGPEISKNKMGAGLVAGVSVGAFTFVILLIFGAVALF